MSLEVQAAMNTSSLSAVTSTSLSTTTANSSPWPESSVAQEPATIVTVIPSIIHQGSWASQRQCILQPTMEHMRGWR